MMTRLLFGSVCFVHVLLCGVNSSEDSFYSGIKVMFRAFSQCDDSDVFTCVKIRAVRYLDRIQTSDELSVLGGLSFQKIKSQDDRKGDIGRDMVENMQELDERNLPQDSVERENTVDKLLFERISRFLTTHTIKLNVPRLLSETILVNEGRGSGGGLGIGGKGGKGGKKGGGLYIIGAMMAGAMKALALKSLALLAGKALLIAKMALVLASVIAISKLTHHDDKTTYEVVHKGHGGYDRVGTFVPYPPHHGPYGRNLKDADPHNLAYSGQHQQTENPSSDSAAANPADH